MVFLLSTYSLLQCLAIDQYVHSIYHFLGAFVPLTKEGKVIVDGVLASCYAGFDHDLAHFLMSPMQPLSEVLE